MSAFDESGRIKSLVANVAADQLEIPVIADGGEAVLPEHEVVDDGDWNPRSSSIGTSVDPM